MLGAFAYIIAAAMALAAGNGHAEIVFAGDAMQHQRQLDAARAGNNTYDYSQCFADIAPWVKSADYAVVNLETTLADKGFTGYPCFCSPYSFAYALKEAGFDLLLNGNNHTLDRRDAGLVRTIDYLDSINVDHTGTYRNSTERAARVPLIRDIRGIKVAFLNYTFCTNGLKVQGAPVVDYTDRDLIRRDVDAARKAGAEIVTVIPHWGTEYRLLPDAWQKSMADFLLCLDVDMIIGGHPHVIQPMTFRTDANGRRRLLVYSLGNFISGMRTTDTRGAAMLRTYLSRDKQGKARVDSAEYRLIYTVPGTSPQNNYRLVFIDENTDIAAATGARAASCRAFVTNATRIFNTHNIEVPRHTTD